MRHPFPYRYLTLLVVVSLVAALPASAETFQAKVRDVTDGDTLVVLKGGRAQVVQIEGIDAPELSQAYGKDAREYVREATRGKKVEVEVVERSGRQQLTARVSVDGEDLGAALVASGLAWADGESGSRELEAAQQKAKQAGEGLWAKADPTPPWEYRANRA